MAPPLHITAPAKLNLLLSAGPPDTSRQGKHPISTWMVTVDLFDELELRQLPAGTLSRYAILWHRDARRRNDIDWSVTSDLAVRAHLLMERRFGSLPVQLKLAKRIPVAAGLGGGSSDAAAMLRGINIMFDLGLTTDQLAELAIELGSDVPFFLRGGSAIAGGFGEQIESHEATPELAAVLVLPEQTCPTGRVYATFDELGPAALRGEHVRSLAGDGSAAPGPDDLFNDLAEAAVTLEPELRELMQRITHIAERPAAMSGSGSTMFVLCDDPIHAEALAEHLEQQLNLPALAVRTWQEHVDDVSTVTG